MFRLGAVLKIMSWLLPRGLLEVSSFCKGSSFSSLTGECIEHAQMGLSPRRAHWGQNESSWRSLSRVSRERLSKVKARLSTENRHGGRQAVLVRLLYRGKGMSLLLIYICSLCDQIMSPPPNPILTYTPQLTLDSWSFCALISKGNKMCVVRTSPWICADEIQHFLQCILKRNERHRCTNLWYNEKSLGLRLILCPISRVIGVGSPLNKCNVKIKNNHNALYKSQVLLSLS